MTYMECNQCETMLDVGGVDTSTISGPCPVCEEVTSWSVAFESEDWEVSF